MGYADKWQPCAFTQLKVDCWKSRPNGFPENWIAQLKVGDTAQRPFDETSTYIWWKLMSLVDRSRKLLALAATGSGAKAVGGAIRHQTFFCNTITLVHGIWSTLIGPFLGWKCQNTAFHTIMCLIWFKLLTSGFHNNKLSKQVLSLRFQRQTLIGYSWMYDLVLAFEANSQYD